MIQLFLDGKAVFPTSNASIKLTRENPFFTKSASYTYDVELPLDIPENRKVFGWLHRMDEHKEPRRMSVRLIVDGITVLVGEAHITQVNEASVKVQLMGESAAYNYGNKMEEVYIDELDLGDWFTTTWPDHSYYVNGEKVYYLPDRQFRGSSHIVFNRVGHNGADHEDFDMVTMDRNIYKKLYGNNDFPWVAFPTLNTNLDMICNNVVFREKDSTSVETVLMRPTIHDITYDEGIPVNTSNKINVCQPYVWIMAEKIAKATGMKLARENNALWTNPFFRRIFIVNTDNNLQCNACLPHWTVNEWWTQIENTFGVIMDVDYKDMSMTLRSRRDHYGTGTRTLVVRNVVDEYTTEMEDESQIDISANNVGFADFDGAPEDFLSDFIRENAVISTQFKDAYELLTYLIQCWNDDTRPPKNTIYKCKDGRHYVYMEEGRGFYEVDMFRPRLANPDSQDVEVELKFVPARFIDHSCALYTALVHKPDSEKWTQSLTGSTTVRMLQVPGVTELSQAISGDNDLDIELILAGEEDESSASDNKPDLIYIAIDNPGVESMTKEFKIKGLEPFSLPVTYPRPYLRERSFVQVDSPWVREDEPFSLSLIPIAGQQNLAANTVTGAPSISTRVKHCIKFLADSIPDPGEIFLIHNKRFVCEKIEATITADGLDWLMTGYFYELDM